MKSWSGETSPQMAIYAIELTKRIQAGSRIAEEEFVKTYYHSIRLLLLNKTQNPDIAKDCCQQTLLITLIKIRAGDIVKPESLTSFLKHTATNVATAYFRKERRYTSLNDETLPAPLSFRNEAEQDKDSETIRLILNNVLDSLSVKRDGEILRRFYLRDEEKSIIRRDLDISAAHFDRVLYRAKSRLRQLLNCHEDVKNLFHQSLSHRVRASHSRCGSRYLQKTNTKNLEACQS